MSEDSEISFTSVEKDELLEDSMFNSKDPAERKFARAERIQRRLNNRNRSIDSSNEENEAGPVHHTKLKSNHILDKSVKEAVQELREIKVENIIYEFKRRKSRDTNRKKLLKALKQEATEAEHEFDGIIDKWKQLGIFKDPVDIHNGIATIKERCDLLIKSRDKISAVIKSKIEFAEIEFNKDQKKNLETMEILFKMMSKLIEDIKISFNIQWNIIQKIINNVKDDYIQEKQDKWSKIYDNITKETETLCHNKFRFYQKITNAVETSRKEFNEYYRSQKTALSHSIATSKQHLENIKAAVLINDQKYEYNFEIYYRRCNESTIFGAYQKRRITKLQDVILYLKTKIKSYKASSKDKIKKYEDDIKLVHRRILDIENKADNFAKTNEKIFHEIWNLNKKNCQKLLDTIIKTDKILHEQQLSKEWQQSLTIPLEISNYSSYKNANSLIGSIYQGSTKISKSKSIISKPLFQDDTNDLKKIERYKKLLKYILIVTSDKTGFLTEQRIQVLLKNYKNDEKSLVKVEQIFKALMIENKDDIDLLINFFVPYSFCNICGGGGEKSRDGSIYTISHLSTASFFSTAKSTGENELAQTDFYQPIAEALRYTIHMRDPIEEAVIDVVSSKVDIDEFYKESVESIDIAQCDALDMGEASQAQRKKSMAITRDKMACQYSHSLVISSIYIVKALKDFVEFYYNRVKMTIPSMNERLRRKRFTISRLIDTKDIVDYWQQWKNILNTDSSCIITEWNGLATGLQHYLEVLKQRKLLSEEVVNLRKQNQRLKKIVESYRNQLKALPPVCEIQCVCVFEKSD